MRGKKWNRRLDLRSFLEAARHHPGDVGNSLRFTKLAKHEVTNRPRVCDRNHSVVFGLRSQVGRVPRRNAVLSEERGGIIQRIDDRTHYPQSADQKNEIVAA
jgi:hypothetical protein